MLLTDIVALVSGMCACVCMCMGNDKTNWWLYKETPSYRNTRNIATLKILSAKI